MSAIVNVLVFFASPVLCVSFNKCCNPTGVIGKKINLGLSSFSFGYSLVKGLVKGSLKISSIYIPPTLK